MKKSQAWIFLLLIVMFIVGFLAQLAHCEERPVYCSPIVIQAMKDIWRDTKLGREPYEAAFAVSGTPENPVIYREPQTGQAYYQTVTTFSDTFALFHVHPNGTDPFPSTPETSYRKGGGDTLTADRNHFDIYVVSLQGLSVYEWRTKQMTMLRNNLDWTKIKGCQ